MLSSWASSVIHQNLLHCVHLYLLSTAIFYTRFYCYDDPSYLVFSAFRCCCLIAGFLLWSISFMGDKLNILHWFSVTADSQSPSLDIFFPCEFTGKTPFLFKLTFWCIILWKSDCTEKALMIFLNYFEVMFDRSTLYNSLLVFFDEVPDR